jgi:hypothetical protein
MKNEINMTLTETDKNRVIVGLKLLKNSCNIFGKTYQEIDDLIIRLEKAKAPKSKSKLTQDGKEWLKLNYNVTRPKAGRDYCKKCGATHIEQYPALFEAPEGFVVCQNCGSKQ